MNIEHDKIDAHGHFFRSYLGPNSTIEEYWKEASKIGVARCVASPEPTPEYVTESIIYHPVVWKSLGGSKVEYIQEFLDAQTGKLLAEKPAQKNPYSFTNHQLIDEAHMWNLLGRGHISVMPIHHPYLDTDEEIVDLIKSNDSCAMKFHGIATFAGPSSIRQSVIDALKQTHKPIIVHTDYTRSLHTDPISLAQKMNDAVEWTRWAIQHQIKTLLTHGARLSLEALALARGHKNILIGCAPDLLLTNEPERLAIPTDNFVQSLLMLVPPEQVVFDIDYAWNIQKRNTWEPRDWNMHTRLEQAAEKAGLSTSNLELIYYINAQNFFGFTS